MKKILSLCLIFAILSGFMLIPVSASEAGADSGIEEKILSDLGILSSYDNLDLEISRGEFALMMCKTLGIEKMPAGYKLPYADVSESSEYYEGVYNLYAWRAISDAELFRPDDAITLHEALKIGVASLGYDFIATSSGGWPAGYVNAATQLGIVPRGAAEKITKAQAAEMMYNMLWCELSDFVIDGNGENQYTVKSGNTLLYETWNISVASGVVTDGEGYGVKHESGVGEGFFAVDGFKIKKGTFDTDAYFGETVDAYYTNDTKELRAIAVTEENSNRVLKLTTGQDISFDNNTYTYWENDKEEEKEISSGATIIFNGKCVDYEKSIMVPEYGYVKLISTSGSDADIVFIKSYKQIVAGVKVAANLLVPDKSKEGVSYSFDDEKITFADQDGNASGFEKIAENDVLWISENADGTINDVIVCSDLAVGELSGISPGSVNRIYLDGRGFEVSLKVFEDVTSKYQLGSIVKVCINPDGNIAYVIAEADISAYKVGYLMYSALFGKGMDHRISLKILGSDGIVYAYDMADVFVVNGIAFKGDPQDIYSRLPRQEGYEKSIPTGIVIYNTDRDGKITMLNYSDDIAAKFGGEAQGIFKNAELTDLTDKYVSVKYTNVVSNKGYNRIFMNTSTRFYVPMTEYIATAEDEDYKVVALSGRMPGELHYGYTLTEGNLASDYVVSKYSMGSGSNEFVDEEGASYLVTGISQIIDDEGEQVEKLDCLTATGTLKEFYSQELGFFSKYGLKFGDVIMVTADIDNIVSNFHIIHREGASVLANYTTHTKDSFYGTNNFTVQQPVANAADPNIGLVPGIYPPVDATGKPMAPEGGFGCVLNNNTGMGTIPNQLVHLGRVYISQGEFMKVLPYKYDPETYAAGGYDGETVNMYSYSLKGNQVLIVNPKAETVEVGTAFDVKGYTAFGKNAHTALVFGSSVVSMMVLYEYE